MSGMLPWMTGWRHAAAGDNQLYTVLTCTGEKMKEVPVSVVQRAGRFVCARRCE